MAVSSRITDSLYSGFKVLFPNKSLEKIDEMIHRAVEKHLELDDEEELVRKAIIEG